VLLAPRADLARAADPGRFGLPTASDEQLARRHFRRRRGGVSWATLTAHFRDFVLGEAATDNALWEWCEDGPDWQQRYTAEKQKSSAEAAAYAVGSCFKAHLRLSSRATAADVDPSKTKWSTAAAGRAIDGADRRGSDQKVLDPQALTPSETILLVIAGQAARGRIGEAVVLELQMCARHHGVSADLVPLSPGLWALQNCGDDNLKRTNFIAEVRSKCAALRRAPMFLVSTTPTAHWASKPAAVASAVSTLIPMRQQTSHALQFSLETEGLYPENVSARLPYHKPTAVVAFAIAVAAELGRAGCEYCPVDGTIVKDEHDKHKLVAIEALSPHTADPSGRLILACETASSSGGGTPFPLLCESPFWGAWSQRSHQFEGCLDLHLAIVAVNVARYITIARQRVSRKLGEETESSLQLRLLDPCCGSGTITAAALGAGGWGQILATELRPEWVKNAQSNLHSLSSVIGENETAEQNPPTKRARVQKVPSDSSKSPPGRSSGTCLHTTWRVKQHDATLDFDRADTTETFDAVVANPPWGKRIGQGTDSATLIVRSLLRQFPTAVHVIFSPSLARCVTRNSSEADVSGEGEEGWEVLHEVKVGGKTSMFVLVKN
jgi:predicted RNA methylase